MSHASTTALYTLFDELVNSHDVDARDPPACFPGAPYAWADFKDYAYNTSLMESIDRRPGDAEIHATIRSFQRLAEIERVVRRSPALPTYVRNVYEQRHCVIVLEDREVVVRADEDPLLLVLFFMQGTYGPAVVPKCSVVRWMEFLGDESVHRRDDEFADSPYLLTCYESLLGSIGDVYEDNSRITFESIQEDVDALVALVPVERALRSMAANGIEPAFDFDPETRRWTLTNLTGETAVEPLDVDHFATFSLLVLDVYGKELISEREILRGFGR